MSALRVLEPRSESEHPRWDETWTVADLAAHSKVSQATIYSAVQRGELDFARLPTGRAIRFSGPALAGRFMVPGYQEGGGVKDRGSNTQRPGATTPSASVNRNY